MTDYDCKIIGSGTYDDPYRPAIADLMVSMGTPASYGCQIPVDPKTGLPTVSRVVVKANLDEPVMDDAIAALPVSRATVDAVSAGDVVKVVK